MIKRKKKEEKKKDMNGGVTRALRVPKLSQTGDWNPEEGTPEIEELDRICPDDLQMGINAFLKPDKFKGVNLKKLREQSDKPVLGREKPKKKKREDN